MKIRGFRVELEEVEAVLGPHPAIARVAVVAVEEGSNKRLTACFVAKASPAPTSRELREWLRERLPDFMVPSTFVAMAELPRTANGKIDRSCLAALPAPASGTTGTGPDASRDPVERRLAEIWEKLLECGPIGPSDDFFDLGGHSLLAVRLFAEIEARTGTRLPLASLLSAPTIRDQAELLRAGEPSPRSSSLVPIQPQGSLPPLFCVHAHEGNAVFYRDLARHLGADQPVFGLQARGVDGGETPLTRVEDMAARYLTEIRTLQPEGPYHLAGYCFGGRIAFEMARQLEAAGERVGFLGLVDSYTAAFVRGLAESLGVRHRLARLAHQIDLHGSNLFLLPPGARRAYLAARLRKLADRVAVRTGAGLTPHRRRLLEAMREATRAYDPAPYGGRITLFRARKQPLGYPRDPEMGWGPLSASVEVHEMPGHYGVLLAEPRVRALADSLAECLRRARLEAESAARVVASALTPNRETHA